MEEAGYEYVPLPEMLATLDKTRLKMVETSRGDKRQYYLKKKEIPEIKTAEGYFYKYNPETGKMEPIGGPGKPPPKPTEYEPTAAERSKAKGWLLRQPGITEADKKRLETDEGFFYWCLEQARLESEEI